MADFLLYGATGYVGRAAAQLAVDRGLQPILGGRNGPALEEEASDLGVEYRVASVDDDANLMRGTPARSRGGPCLDCSCRSRHRPTHPWRRCHTRLPDTLNRIRSRSHLRCRRRRA
jgi:hypothetical protein